MRIGLGKTLIVSVILMMIASMPLLADTSYVKLVFQNTDVWAYNTSNTSKVEVYVYANYGVKGCSLGFAMNRRIIKIDSIYLDSRYAAVPIKQAVWKNDTIFTSLNDTLSYFLFGLVEFVNPTIWPTGQEVLLGTANLSFKADSIPLWGNDSVRFAFDSSYIPPAGKFIFTTTGGVSAVPQGVQRDSTWLKVSSAVWDINPGVMPISFELGQNYPNPFNPDTWIEFAVPNKSFVNLAIYNIMGQRVRTLVDEELEAGWKSVLWDGKDDSGNDVASGIYLYRVKSGDFVDSKKMMMLK